MEVLISVAILAVGVTALLESIINSMDATELTQKRTRAVFLAETKMWQIESDYAFQQDMPTGPNSGEFDPPFHEYWWESEIESDEDAVEYQIKVTIYFNHGDIQKIYSLDTIVPMRRSDDDLKV